jgi:CubicO group peptidase (beta-lactamase class C family)
MWWQATIFNLHRTRPTMTTTPATSSCTRRAALTLTSGALMSLTACGGGDPSAVASAQIKAVLAAARGADPGLAAAWISSADVVLAADGRTRAAGAAPLSTGMWFHIGSNFKAMVAMALAVQVEQGRLRWTSTLAELFPELAPAMLPAYRRVTIEHLLSHRAGFVELLTASELEIVPAFDGDVSSQRLQFIAWATSVPPLGAPGQTFLYSNAGYGVAGAVLERLTGKAFEAAMTDTLFGPLGLRHAFAYPPELTGTQPSGHEVDASGTALAEIDLTDPLYTPPVYLYAAGHLSMPLADYARFAQIQLRGLRGEPTLLAAETFQKLHRSLGAIPDSHLEYASGWVVEPSPGNTALSWSVGQLIGFTAIIMISPGTDRATLVVANFNDGLRPDVMNATARRLLALNP